MRRIAFLCLRGKRGEGGEGGGKKKKTVSPHE